MSGLILRLCVKAEQYLLAMCVVACSTLVPNLSLRPHSSLRPDWDV